MRLALAFVLFIAVVAHAQDAPAIHAFSPMTQMEMEFTRIPLLVVIDGIQIPVILFASLDPVTMRWVPIFLFIHGEVDQWGSLVASGSHYIPTPWAPPTMIPTISWQSPGIIISIPNGL